MGNYELWFGYFEGETFVWKILKKFTTFQEAYREYKKFVEEQFKLDDEDLQEKWGSTRLDIELREHGKKINWVGLYTRKVDTNEDEKDKEKESDKEDKKDEKGASAKDSVPFELSFLVRINGDVYDEETFYEYLDVPYIFYPDVPSEESVREDLEGLVDVWREKNGGEDPHLVKFTEVNLYERNEIVKVYPSLKIGE